MGEKITDELFKELRELGEGISSEWWGTIDDEYRQLTLNEVVDQVISPGVALVFGSLETKIETVNKIIDEYKKHLSKIKNGEFDKDYSKEDIDWYIEKCEAFIKEKIKDREGWVKELWEKEVYKIKTVKKDGDTIRSDINMLYEGKDE